MCGTSNQIITKAIPIAHLGSRKRFKDTCSRRGAFGEHPAVLRIIRIGRVQALFIRVTFRWKEVALVFIANNNGATSARARRSGKENGCHAMRRPGDGDYPPGRTVCVVSRSASGSLGGCRQGAMVKCSEESVNRVTQMTPAPIHRHLFTSRLQNFYFIPPADGPSAAKKGSPEGAFVGRSGGVGSCLSGGASRLPRISRAARSTSCRCCAPTSRGR
jgi:hypothetical protein